jgi:outer membrane protein OmpA-like peptidoglycan-associated protein
VHFDPGSYFIKDSQTPLLDTIAALLIKYDPYSIRVVGHSDSLENQSSGKELSLKRAEFVMKYLIYKGVPSEKMSAAGYGKDVPVGSNDSEEGRSANRRVEFLITENKRGKEARFESLETSKDQNRLMNIHLALGRSLFAENRYKESIVEFNKALELAPGNKESLEYVGKAEDILSGKARIKQDAIDLKLAKMRNIFNEAQALFVKGKFQESINMFKKVLEIDPLHTESIKYIKRAREKIFEKLIVLDDKHFDFNTAILTKAGAKVVKKNIRILKENPETKIRIEGYTSAAGGTEYNQKLSERRARAVAAILIEGGITPERLTTIGYGETNPAVFEPSPNHINSKEAHANMRVLFEVIVK